MGQREEHEINHLFLLSVQVSDAFNVKTMENKWRGQKVFQLIFIHRLTNKFRKENS